MSVQTVTLRLPEDIYQCFVSAANDMKRPIEEVLYHSVKNNLPPRIDKLPVEMRQEANKLQTLQTSALWKAAKEPLPTGQWERHESLLERNQDGILTKEERKELEHLNEITDRFMLRRSYILALLKWRGQSFSLPQDLM